MNSQLDLVRDRVPCQEYRPVVHGTTGHMNREEFLDLTYVGYLAPTDYHEGIYAFWSGEDWLDSEGEMIMIDAQYIEASVWSPPASVAKEYDGGMFPNIEDR